MGARKNPVTASLVFLCPALRLAAGYWFRSLLGVPLFIVAALIAASLKTANVWQKFVVLRLERQGLGPFLKGHRDCRSSICAIAHTGPKRSWVCGGVQTGRPPTSTTDGLHRQEYAMGIAKTT
jgi:hypothetical protein